MGPGPIRRGGSGKPSIQPTQKSRFFYSGTGKFQNRLVTRERGGWLRTNWVSVYYRPGVGHCFFAPHQNFTQNGAPPTPRKTEKPKRPFIFRAPHDLHNGLHRQAQTPMARENAYGSSFTGQEGPGGRAYFAPIHGAGAKREWGVVAWKGPPCD